MAKAVKDRICKCCKNSFAPYKTTDVVCSVRCAIVLAKVKVEKDNKKAEATIKRVQRTKDKELKESVINWKKKLQSKVQEIARLIDVNQNCTARDIKTPQSHGGHVFARGSHSNMAFNLHNIHIQSSFSNHYQSDDRLMHNGVIRIYGQDYYDNLVSLQQTPVIKITNDEYKEAYRRASKFANGIRKANDYFDNYKRNVEQRCSARNLANLAIGIYEQKYCEFKII